MTSEARLLIETWEAVRDRLPATHRSDVAEGIVAAFAEFGFEYKDLVEATDEDADLGEAIGTIFAESVEESEDYAEED